MELNAYNANYTFKTENADNLKIQKNNQGLSMQDFFNLLVAQITNQDVLNPMDNTEFVAQMAQFSSLQAMSDLTDMAIQGQATSLIGKNVVVAYYNKQGKMEIQEGIVEKVSIFGANTKIHINDNEFDYFNVMEIKEAKKEAPAAEIPEDIPDETKSEGIPDETNTEYNQKGDDEIIPQN